MSYLHIPKGIPNFKQAVISFWFRVPKESVLATAARASSEPDAFVGVMPLIVFGKPQKKQNFRFLFGDILTNPEFSFDHYYAFYDWETVGDPYDVGPSYIGLVVNRDGSGTFDLGFNLQLDTYGTYSAIGWVATSATQRDAGSAIVYDLVLKDTTPTILYGPPEFFYIQTILSRAPIPPEKWLQPDVWHHLLLSFDLTGSLAIGHPFATSTCRMWYAIDDKDCRGPENLGPNRNAPNEAGEGGDGLGPNIILTDNIHTNSNPASGEFLGVPVADPSGSYFPASVPTNGQAFGIPGTPQYVQDICRTEFAEFQLFTGVTLDTGIETKRRAFIDYERDNDGNPLKDKDGNHTLLPVNPKDAEELLQKKPDILLHGSSKWIGGENTGTIGVDYGVDPPQEKPAGQFQSTGKIRAYTPDPSLQPQS